VGEKQQQQLQQQRSGFPIHPIIIINAAQ